MNHKAYAFGLFIAALQVCNIGRSVTASANYASVTVTWNGLQQRFDYSASTDWSPDTPNHVERGVIRVWYCSTNGSTVATSQAVVSDGGTYPWSDSGSFVAPAGQWILLFAKSQNGAGTITHSGPNYAWIQAGGPCADHHVVVRIPANSSDRSKSYKLLDGSGDQVGTTVVQQAGAGAILQSATFNSCLHEGPFSLVESVTGISTDGEHWYVVNDATTTTVLKDGIQSSPTPDPTPVEPDPTKVNQTPNQTTNDPAKQSVWRVTTPQTAGTQTDLLTIPTYREGVDKITSFLEPAEQDRVADRKAWTTSKESNWETTPAAKQAAAKTSMDTALGGTGITGEPVATSSAWNIPIGGVNYDIAPWNNPPIHSAAGIMKAILAVFMGYTYIRWLLGDIKKTMAVISLAPQTRGNTVAGSGGQITGLIAAAVITGLILGVPVVLASLTETGLFGWKTVTNVFSPLTSGGDSGSKAHMLLSEFFPIVTAVSIMGSYITTITFSAGAMTAVAIAIRWVVPVIVLGFIFFGSDVSAAVLVRNGTAMTLDVRDRRADTSLAVMTGAGEISVPAVAGGVYEIREVVGAGSHYVAVVEALDEGYIEIPNAPALVTVAHPSSVWIVHLMKGFVMGLIWEITGFGIRLFSRSLGSSEAV